MEIFGNGTYFFPNVRWPDVATLKFSKKSQIRGDKTEKSPNLSAMNPNCGKILEQEPH